MNLMEFLKTYEKELNEKIIQNTKPVFIPGMMDEKDSVFSETINRINGDIKPYRPQRDVVIATRKQLDKTGAVFIVAEMSCGKSMMAILANVLNKDPGRHLIMCPPHLVKKWVREVNKVVPERVAVAYNINSRECIGVLASLPLKKPEIHEFYVASRERWKNSFAWKHAFATKKHRDVSGDIYDMYVCPCCGSAIDMSLWGEGRKNKCLECNSPLWEADRNKSRRFSPAEYVKKKIKKHYFNTLIADELHELKGESAQGVAFGQLASRCKNVIGLTGTLLGGYADDIFYLLWRMFPALMVKNEENFRNKKGWIEKYGILEKVFKSNGDDNKSTRSLRLSLTRRKPGISPVVLSKFLIPNSIFMKLSDLHGELPPYAEIIHEVEMDDNQKEEYLSFEMDLKDAMMDALQSKDKSILSRMLQALLSWPDDCRKKAEVMNKDNLIVARAMAQNIDILPKEQILTDLILKNKQQGRKVLVYVEYTGTKDITGSLGEILEKSGIRPLHLKSSINAEKRQEWIEQQMKTEKFDCMICNPKLVQTGLDLLGFPTIVYYQTGTSVYVLRQASRRSWRLGQKKNVEVHFMTYKETMQSKLLTLMAKKMETSLSIEGDLDENGLSSLSGSQDNIVLEMARSIVSNTSTGSLELAWQSYRNADKKASGMPCGEEKSTDNVSSFSIIKRCTEQKRPVKFKQLDLFAM